MTWRPCTTWMCLAVALPAQAEPLDVRAIDAADAPADRVSIERTPPAVESSDDPDAIRFLVIGEAGSLPGRVSVASFGRSAVVGEDAAMDTLEGLALEPRACPSGVAPERVCAATPLVRAVMDDVDRQHPLVKDRSIKVELGGSLVVSTPKGGSWLSIRVGGPRSLAATADGPLSARLRVRLVRLDPGGVPPVGSDDADALERARGEVARAAMVWGECGIDLGDPAALDVKLVDPPPPHLLAIGCDAGAPASGGLLRFEADGKPVEVRVPKGTSPRGAARLASAALKKAGFLATIFDGAPGLATTYGASDVSVRRKSGELATLATSFEAASDGAVLRAGHASTDATLDACIGSVSMGDGFDHFSDANAVLGAIEERTLIRAFDDGDPTTLEVLVVPSFGGTSRIGESFIFADGGSIRNVVIEDRAGFRSERASFTLAHELGHVLLGDPGHPDDYDGDTPTRLMDADAVNGSAFGPRRLEVSECARAFVESGPSSPVPILARPPATGAKTPAPTKKPAPER